MKSISVITATYNRSNTIKRTYRSLLQQTKYDFEWIIIDDGSSDDTENIVLEFKNKKNPFPIRYNRKENGGKHTALNMAFELVDSEWSLILDSDDWLEEDAIEIILEKSKYLMDNNNGDIGSMYFFNKDYMGNVIGEPLKENITVCYINEVDIKWDMASVFKSSYLKENIFPMIEDENYIGESIVWNKIGIEHLCAFFNIPICNCEYLEDGLSKKGRRLRLKNPKGGMLLNNERMVKPFSLKIRMKSAILFSVYGKILNLKAITIIKMSNDQMITFLCMPIAGILKLIWTKKYL